MLILAGVLFDVDHLVVYSLRTGDWRVTGALGYNRYRHKPSPPGDTRPRYGILRSWLHQPLVVLPPLWWLARRHPACYPTVIGITLHLALDVVDLWTGKRPRESGPLHRSSRNP